MTRNIRSNHVTCLLLVLAVLSSCSKSEIDQARPQSVQPTSVGVISQAVSFSEDRSSVESVGTSRALYAATIYPETGGEVKSVRFSSGQFVKKGQTLATLDDVQQKLAVARAKVRLQDADQILARYKRIDVPGAISESQIDAAQTAVEAAKIDLLIAEESLSQRTIFAPFSGYVGLTDIDAGARITPQTVLTRLDDRTSLFVDFDLPEQVFSQIKSGSELTIIPFAASRTPVKAIITTVGTRIDAERRSFSVRAEVDNTNDALRPGMSFRVSFQVPGEMYPSVPEAAIVWGADGPYIWTIEESKAKRVPVTIVGRDDGVVLVRAPLEAGDRIIAEGVQKVRDGATIRDLSTPGSDVQKTGSSRAPLSGAAAQ